MIVQEEMDLGDVRTHASDGCETTPFDVDLSRVDLESASNEVGELRDENGVDLWRILKDLKTMGVSNVHMI